jgi:hypothetical protein
VLHIHGEPKNQIPGSKEWEKMKALGKPCLLLLAFAVPLSLSSCDLFNAINLYYVIDDVFDYPAFQYARIDYTVENMGRIDLTGVNIRFGVDTTGNGDYTDSADGDAWTMDFNIDAGEVRSGTINVRYTGTSAVSAAIIGVDMDNPKD